MGIPLERSPLFIMYDTQYLLEELSTEEFENMTDFQLVQATKSLRKTVMDRIKKIKKYDKYDPETGEDRVNIVVTDEGEIMGVPEKTEYVSYAYRKLYKYMKERYGYDEIYFKPPTLWMERDELENEFFELRNFATSVTSTVEGMKEVQSNLAYRLYEDYNVDFSKEQIDKMWEVYSKIQEEPTFQIWFNKINKQFLKSDQIQKIISNRIVNNPDLSADAIVKEMEKFAREIYESGPFGAKQRLDKEDYIILEERLAKKFGEARPNQYGNIGREIKYTTKHRKSYKTDFSKRNYS